jgi:RPAP1-like, N-terminal
MSEENEKLVAAMTEEEREQERSQIGEKFGKNIGDVLRKARMAREAHGKTVASLEGDGTLSGSYEVKLPYLQISNAFKTVHTAFTGTLFQLCCTLS